MTRLPLLLFFVILIGCPAVLTADNLATDSAQQTLIPVEYGFDGRVEATQQSTISAQTQGQVTAILVDVDDFVEQGTIILRLKDTEQRAQVDLAKAEQKAAAAQLQEARKEHDRTQEIFQRKLVAQSAMDKATANLKSARARQDAAIAALSQAEEQLAYTQVRAPYSGIVTERLIEMGETATPGQRLLSGISLDLLRISVDVPQSLISDIRKDPKVRILLPNGQFVMIDAITIFPFANPTSGTFTVRLELPSGITGLFPGMLVKTLFEIGQTEQLLIPASSVVYRSEVTAVYVIAPDHSVSMRHIQTGQKYNGTRVAVLSGLEPGEQVALDPVAAGSQLKMQLSRLPK